MRVFLLAILILTVPMLAFSAESALPAGASARLGTLQLQAGADVHCVVFSPDGKQLATGAADAVVRLWDVATRQERLSLRGHQGIVYAVAFSPDGKLLASGGKDGSVRVWDLAAGRELHRYGGHRDDVYSVAFSPDGRTLASGGDDRTLRLWDVASGQERRRLSGHQREIFSVAFAADGRTVASGSRDQTTRLWGVATGTQRGLLGEEIRVALGQATTWIAAVAFSTDGRVMAMGGRTGSAALLDMATGDPILTLAGPSDVVSAIAFSPDGQTLAIGGSGPNIRLWNRITGQELGSRGAHADAILSIAFSPDGSTMASGSADGTVLLWDLRTLRRDRRAEPLDARALDQLWEELGSAAPTVAYEALGKLLTVPQQAVALCKQRLHPLGGDRPKTLAQLLTELDDDRFTVRNAARKELAQLGPLAESALFDALLTDLSPEVRRSVERLLRDLDQPPQRTPPEELRRVRAIQALETIGTPEARAVLQTLAGGSQLARQTLDATAALRRLERRMR